MAFAAACLRMVCTEVVYRAYAGIGGIEITPRMRIGRPTISAEDLLDLAVDGSGFEVVAVYGAKGCRRRPVTGAAARETLACTYRPAAAPPS